MLTIGVLIGVAVGLFVIANQIGEERQEAMNREDPAFQAAVNARIQPFGVVVLDGEAAQHDAAAPVETPTEAHVVLTGPQVYNQACTACHSTGAGGAPKVGESAEWGPRIATGMGSLNEHAINGYQGSVGFMPAKGGFADLLDDEVIAAVQFMVDESK